MFHIGTNGYLGLILVGCRFSEFYICFKSKKSAEEFIKFFLSETIESVLLGDRKYDKDYFEEWLNGINEELNGIGVSESEILKLDEKVAEALEDALKVTSTGSNKVWKAISTFLRGSVLGIVAVCFFISLGVMLVFIGILFLVVLVVL